MTYSKNPVSLLSYIEYIVQRPDCIHIDNGASKGPKIFSVIAMKLCSMYSLQSQLYSFAKYEYTSRVNYLSDTLER